MLIDNNIRKPASPVGRYLLYALGEIMLVVIGILIALQINNWNDNRLKEREAKTFYQNILQQIFEDRQNIEGQINYNNKDNQAFNYAISLISQNDRSEKDSLCAVTGKLVDYSDFDRQGNIYETIVNSGDVKLLKNEEIKKRLRRLEETYLYINRMETIHYDAIMQMIPEISRTLNFTSKEVIDEDRLYSAGFQNQFVLSLRLINEKEQVYFRALDEIDALVSLIGEELK
jgi:predicted transcriptional regulator YdeE